jgi:RNA polymerase sigma factor (sigma-70 family)
MTANTGGGTPVALHAELLAAAGPERVLTMMSLRRLLVGTDRTVLVEALTWAAREGIALPPSVAAQFGVVVPDPAAAPAPAEPAPTPLAEKALELHFSIDVDHGTQLNLAALSIKTLFPDTTTAPSRPAAPSTPSVTATVAPAQPSAPSFPPKQRNAPKPADPANEAFELSEAKRPVFNSLKYYQKRIAMYPLLSREQEGELAQAIEAGLLARAKLDDAKKIAPKLRSELRHLVRLGEQAFIDFTQANLRLVVAIASRSTGRGVDLLDLIQEGNIGLVHAIHRFDHRLGYKFSTYAVNWIRQSIQRALANQSRTIRLPADVHDAVTALNRAADTLGYASPQEALSEVAAHADITLDKATTVLSRVRQTLPLEHLHEAIGDEALHEEVDRSVRGPHVCEPDTHFKDLSPETIQRLLTGLGARERQVLILRFGLDGEDPLTLRAAGAVMGTTGERVRQVQSEAMAILRERLAEHLRLPPPPSPTTSPAPAPEPPRSKVDPAPAPPVDLTGKLHVTRKVHHTGQIMVDRQTIYVGIQYIGEIVTVLIEDEWFRVLLEGHPVAAVPRRHRPGSPFIYGLAG